MSEIRPLRGIRPRSDLAGSIIALPYDVPSETEARAIAGANPRSFLHVTRPEVDMPLDADAHAPEAYRNAAATFERFLADGWLVEEDRPCLYLYRQSWRGHTQTGLLASCSVQEYDDQLIKQHELTRPDKEQDRVDHISALGAQTGLVFLAYRDEPRLEVLMQEAAETPVDWSVTTDDDVTHVLQTVRDPGLIERLQAAFREVPALYVADGHHRSAAASRVARARGGAGESGWFLAGVFPDSQLRIMAYNRMVIDLNGHTAEGFIDALSEHYEIVADVEPMPVERGRLTMYLGDTWYGLVPLPGVVPDDPVAGLDVSVLQDRVLRPLLGIENPRTDTRIRFVGGIKGPGALAAAVQSGAAAVAFQMYPTGMAQLLAVADAGLLMPPKSTWFEPKLRGGVLVHRI